MQPINDYELKTLLIEVILLKKTNGLSKNTVNQARQYLFDNIESWTNGTEASELLDQIL